MLNKKSVNAFHTVQLHDQQIHIRGGIVDPDEDECFDCTKTIECKDCDVMKGILAKKKVVRR